MTTPPSTNSRFNSDPIKSPFPYSPQLHHSHAITDSNKNRDGFTSLQLREIATIFQLFDPTLSGVLDVSAFEVMMLSLGYRVTRQDIIGLVHSIGSKSEQEDVSLIEDDGMVTIDQSMAIQILSKKGYATQQSSEARTRIYFRLFDVDDKGYITVEDLRRVRRETIQLEEEMFGSSNEKSLYGIGEKSDDFVHAILEKFDKNGDGKLDFDEFRLIVHF